jgi:uncharacterized membrane protein YqhA
VSGFLAPIFSIFDPLWTVIATRTWLCVGVLVGLIAAMGLLHLPVIAAILTGVLALVLMWKSEHDQEKEAKLPL